MIGIKRHKQLDDQLYRDIMTIWQQTGITNPARADSFEAIQHNLDHTGTLITASLDSILAGAVWVNHDYRRLYIHHMGVVPEYQNRGIGRALLQEAIAIASETGYQAKLEVHETNLPARHLYSDMGFTDLDGYITMIRRDV
jgi:ribosomal protein S18 acetylase RimI-like enzyme